MHLISIKTQKTDQVFRPKKLGLWNEIWGHVSLTLSDPWITIKSVAKERSKILSYAYKFAVETAVFVLMKMPTFASSNVLEKIRLEENKYKVHFPRGTVFPHFFTFQLNV